jgi:hypothetical protein
MADKTRKLVRKSGVGARIVVLDAMVFVPTGVSKTREEEHCEWLGWSAEGDKSAYFTLDDPGDAADYKSGSGTMTSEKFDEWAREACRLVRELYGDYPVEVIALFDNASVRALRTACSHCLPLPLADPPPRCTAKT